MSKIETLNKKIRQNNENLIDSMYKIVKNCTCGHNPHIKLIETIERGGLIQKDIVITCYRCDNNLRHIWISEDREDVEMHMMEAVSEWNSWVKPSKEQKHYGQSIKSVIIDESIDESMRHQDNEPVYWQNNLEAIKHLQRPHDLPEHMGMEQCKCGGIPHFHDRDDFENNTKTYIITCYSCGQNMSYVRKIGEISPKKAITGLIREWNRQQVAAADEEA